MNKFLWQKYYYGSTLNGLNTRNCNLYLLVRQSKRQDYNIIIYTLRLGIKFVVLS